jgi:hypothetical protein
MEKIKKQWEAMIYRPTLPTGWDCFEQRGIIRYAETVFSRSGRDHHNATEDRNFFVVFCEFDTTHNYNDGIQYEYTVHGGNDIKPSMDVRYFKHLKDAENYMIYLMESTDRWIDEIHSQKHIDADNKRIADLIKADNNRRIPEYEL